MRWNDEFPSVAVSETDKKTTVRGMETSHTEWATEAVRQLLERALLAIASEFRLLARGVRK